MRAEELISAVSKLSEEKERFEKLKKEIPLGEDAAGQVVTALKAEKPLKICYTERIMCPPFRRYPAGRGIRSGARLHRRTQPPYWKG